MGFGQGFVRLVVSFWRWFDTSPKTTHCESNNFTNTDSKTLTALECRDIPDEQSRLKDSLTMKDVRELGKQETRKEAANWRTTIDSRQQAYTLPPPKPSP